MTFHKRVNRFLAEWVSLINALVAVGLPSIGAIAAGVMAGSAGFGDFSVLGFLGGFILGAVVGILVVGPLCGMLAVMVDIRNSLASQDESS